MFKKRKKRTDNIIICRLLWIAKFARLLKVMINTTTSQVVGKVGQVFGFGENERKRKWTNIYWTPRSIVRMDKHLVNVKNCHANWDEIRLNFMKKCPNHNSLSLNISVTVTRSTRAPLCPPGSGHLLFELARLPSPTFYFSPVPFISDAEKNDASRAERWGGSSNAWSEEKRKKKKGRRNDLSKKNT